ncbi:hypothetical protein ACHAXS_009503 [Conticribra weissflogii]
MHQPASPIRTPFSLFHFPNPIAILNRDFQALTRRVTAHHILLPKSTEVALALKQKLRNTVSPSPESGVSPTYVVDAFSAAAEKYSQDEETAVKGGLLGTLVPQGYCRAKELDKACFECPLGVISGPIESEYGFHLLLVTERTNCQNLDGEYTKIARDRDGVGVVYLKFAENQEFGASGDLWKFTLQQVGFWMAITFAGGIVAEIAAKAANVVEELPWEW